MGFERTRNVDLYEQIEYWINNRTLIELHTITKGNRRKCVHGRICSFDRASSKLLFYNDDSKTVENILLSEIENVFPAQSSSPAPLSQAPSSAESTSKKTAEPVNRRHQLLDEICSQLEQLSDEDLETLLPLVRRLNQKQPAGTSYAG